MITTAVATTAILLAPRVRLVTVIGAVLDTVADGVAVHAGAVVAAEGARTAGWTVRLVADLERLVRAVAAVGQTVAERLSRYALTVAAAVFE